MSRVSDPVALIVNGTRYAIPKETEITVDFGGETITDTQEFGDGTADAVVSMNIAKFMGVKVKVSDSNRETFNADRAKSDIPIVLQCVTKSYEMTGCVVGSKEMTANRELSGEFECRCTDGSGIRVS